jgi:hypothetical protein
MTFPSGFGAEKLKFIWVSIGAAVAPTAGEFTSVSLAFTLYLL